MAYTTPTTRASGAVITESIWNTDLVDNITYLKTERDIAVQASPVGHLVMWPTTTAPTKFLLCAGQAISRTTYSALFAVIGTQFGAGDGSTTFNLPDLRGRFPLGLDNMGGTSANRVTASAADTMGGSGGAETHTLTAAELAAHNHTVTGSTAAGSQNNFTVIGSRNADYTITTSNNAGGGSAHNNMPPYLAINFIIYAGV